MGLMKNEMMEHYELDLRRYEELIEMNLEDTIKQLNNEIEEQKDEIRNALDYDDVEELDNIDNVISEIKELESRKSEYEDYIDERNELKEQLKKY